ncbi:unnamed protein product [Linum tenue]|uniref:Uncharacterized protein n=1 Tax=Linum tenue TaxID=586396 RepID=A0AAV0NYR3_9ROSI|nr:unnamed protein product [Linum tenue]
MESRSTANSSQRW